MIFCDTCGAGNSRAFEKCWKCGKPLIDTEPNNEPLKMNICPECGKSEMIPSEGCAMCPICGYSPCSG